MKKLPLLACAIFLASLTFAQTSQGNLLLAGGVAFGVQNQKQESGGSTFEDGHLSLNLTPMVGFFVADGIVVGGMVDFGWEKLTDKLDNQNYSTNSSWTVGPFGRYYHHSDWFGHAGVSFGASKSEFVFGGSPSSTSENSIFGFEVGGGKAIFFNEFVGLEPMLVWQSTTSTNKEFSDQKQTLSGPVLKVVLTFFLQ